MQGKALVTTTLETTPRIGVPAHRSMRAAAIMSSPQNDHKQGKRLAKNEVPTDADLQKTIPSSDKLVGLGSKLEVFGYLTKSCWNKHLDLEILTSIWCPAQATVAKNQPDCLAFTVRRMSQE